MTPGVLTLLVVFLTAVWVAVLVLMSRVGVLREELRYQEQGRGVLLQELMTLHNQMSSLAVACGLEWRAGTPAGWRKREAKP